MRKLLVFCLLFLVLFSSGVFAEDLTCQYKVEVPSEALRRAPFDVAGTRLSDVQIILPPDLREEGNKPLMAINPNALDMKINLSIPIFAQYYANPNREICNFYELKIFTIDIPALSSTEVSPRISAPSGCDWFMFKHDFSINYLNTDYVTSKPVPLYYNFSCKMCGVKICKNDGENCSSGLECGSTICNIAGVCGDKIIVPCPGGRLNCNNQSCVEPHVKKTGQVYSCEIECISEVGKDGVCKLNNGTKCSSNSDCISDICNPLTHICGTKGCPPNSFNHLDRDCINTYDLLFGVLVFLLTCLGIYKVVRYYIIIQKVKEAIKLGKEKAATDKAVNDERARKLENDEKDLKLKRETLELEAAKSRRELEKIKEQIEKEKLNNTLTSDVRKKHLENLTEIEKEYWEKIKTTNDKITAEREAAEKAEVENKIYRETPKFGIYGYKYYLNSGWYPCFCDSGKLVHLYVYKNKSGDLTPVDSDKERIHHIDGNKSNYDIYNLIRVTKAEHEEVHYQNKNRDKIIDYASGIRALQRVGIALPERIKQYCKTQNISV